MTRETIETRICGLFVGGEYEAINISEIARRIGAAYPHTHAAVTEMLKDGILLSIKIARSTFCRPNLENELTVNLLAQAQLRRKRKQLNKPTLKNLTFKNLDAELHDLVLKQPQILAAILKDEAIILVVPDLTSRRQILKETSLITISFCTPVELRQQLLQTRFLEDATVIVGYERLLLLMRPIIEQQMLNHASVFRNQSGYMNARVNPPVKKTAKSIVKKGERK